VFGLAIDASTPLRFLPVCLWSSMWRGHRSRSAQTTDTPSVVDASTASFALPMRESEHAQASESLARLELAERKRGRTWLGEAGSRSATETRKQEIIWVELCCNRPTSPEDGASWSSPRQKPITFFRHVFWTKIDCCCSFSENR